MQTWIDQDIIFQTLKLSPEEDTRLTPENSYDNCVPVLDNYFRNSIERELGGWDSKMSWKAARSKVSDSFKGKKVDNH